MKYLVCLLIFFVLSVPASAQVPTSEEPGAAAARFEQAKPSQATRAGMLRLPEIPSPELDAGITIYLRSVTIVGASVYDDELEALFAEFLDREVSLSAIYTIAQRITQRYGDDGYVLSRAIVPPQEIDPKAATVTIEVVEVYVDQVVWPASLERYRDFFSGYAAKIVAERPSNIQTVMRYLLLADDLPGVDVSSRFEASASNSHASSLVVEVTGKPLDAFVQLDNRGTEARGPGQFLASATFNNLLGQHEAFTATVAGAIEADDWPMPPWAIVRFSLTKDSRSSRV